MMMSSITATWGLVILHGVNLTEKKIGRGAYGRVFEVDYEGTLCAAKEVHTLLLHYYNMHNATTSKRLKMTFYNYINFNECQIWSILCHPCIVQFLPR